MKGFGRFAALTVLLLSAWAAAAEHRVVVLEFEGDRGNKVRAQVEGALKRFGQVEVVSLKKYKDAAAKKRLRGSQAMTSAAFAKVSRSLRIDAAVEGTVSDGFVVRIVDRSGKEVWSREIKLKGGYLSKQNSQRLAKAIRLAAEQAAAGASTEPAPVEEKEEPAPVAEEKRPEERPEEPEKPEPEEVAKVEPEEPKAKPDEERRDEDLDAERKKTKVRVGPKLVTLSLAGTTTWRAYCSRPGVQSCREYDALPEPKPKGDTVDFSPQVPYAGFALGLELFPLSSVDNPMKGLGVLGSYARGFSLTNVKVQSAAGETPERQVVSADESYSAMLAFRYYFSFGSGKDTLVGFAGIRGGYSARNFDVDPSAQVPLPGSHRGYPSVGADVAIPLAKLVRLEVSGFYFLNPKAGIDEIAGYGDRNHPTGGAEGRGFQVEAGMSGEIWGPLGYTLRFRLSSYSDTFYGQGQKWPCIEGVQCGGAAQETYSGLLWGLTAAF